jgi:hypothetical protein
MKKPPDVAAREYRQRVREASERARVVRELYTARAKGWAKVMEKLKAQATAQEIERDKRRSKAEKF